MGSDSDDDTQTLRVGLVHSILRGDSNMYVYYKSLAEGQGRHQKGCMV